MMRKRWIAVMVGVCVLLAASACAQGSTSAGAAEGISSAKQSASQLKVTSKSRWFVNRYKRTYTRRVEYYDQVYAYNHGKYFLTPFAASVPAEYFVIDEGGQYAVAPIVLDITDAMRVRLYGADVGETYMLYGQYSEMEKAVYQEKGKRGYRRYGFPGIHEGIDFANYPGCPLYSILDGEVIRAGDGDGTVAVYNKEHDCTLLYLHCARICVRIGDEIEAGMQIAEEGKKNAGSYYTHVEFRMGKEKVANKYRNSRLESDCPYPVMQEALGVEPSGRQPVTAAAVEKARKLREEAEAQELAAEQEAQKEPEIELVDILPGTGSGYGFEATTPPAAVPTPAPQAGADVKTPQAGQSTLPPGSGEIQP